MGLRLCFEWVCVWGQLHRTFRTKPPITQNPVFLVGLSKQVPLREDMERLLVRLPCWEEGSGLPWPVGNPHEWLHKSPFLW